MRRTLTLIYTYILHFLSGYLNAVTMVIFAETTGVQTGNTSNVFLRLFSGQYGAALHLFAIVFTFFLATLLVGFLTQFHVSNRTRNLQFVGFHLLTALILALGYVHLWPQTLLVLLISFRLGMQNAFPVPSRKKRIRTTSLTGLITETGLYIGSSLRRRTLSQMRSLMFASLYLLAFVGGVSLMAIIHFQLGLSAMLVYIGLEIMTAVFCFYISIFKD